MNRAVMFYRWLSALALAGLCACGSHAGTPQTGAPAVQDRESVQVAPVIEKYKKQEVLTGFDLKGTTLVVFADTEKYSQLDDSLEAAMKADLLGVWVSAWKSGHPRQHAMLRVLVQNYYGQEMFRLQQTV